MLTQVTYKMWSGFSRESGDVQFNGGSEIALDRHADAMKIKEKRSDVSITARGERVKSSYAYTVN